MAERDDLIAQILTAFSSVQYPGDAYLLGSREGDEPFDEVQPFMGTIFGYGSSILKIA